MNCTKWPSSLLSLTFPVFWKNMAHCILAKYKMFVLGPHSQELMALNKPEDPYQQKNVISGCGSFGLWIFHSTRDNGPDNFPFLCLSCFMAIKSPLEMVNNVDAAESQSIPATHSHHHFNLRICQIIHQPKDTLSLLRDPEDSFFTNDFIFQAFNTMSWSEPAKSGE